MNRLLLFIDHRLIGVSLAPILVVAVLWSTAAWRRPMSVSATTIESEDMYPEDASDGIPLESDLPARLEPTRQLIDEMAARSLSLRRERPKLLSPFESHQDSRTNDTIVPSPIQPQKTRETARPDPSFVVTTIMNSPKGAVAVINGVLRRAGEPLNSFARLIEIDIKDRSVLIELLPSKRVIRTILTPAKESRAGTSE